MFWNQREINHLKSTITKLTNSLNLANEENKRLEEFYATTQKAELNRLNALVQSLTNETNKLRDAKEAARKELQSEYDERAKSIEEDYASKLRIETESNARKIEFIEWQVTTEVNNRTKESMWAIQIENDKLKMKAEHSDETMKIYKKKFEWGKIELGADEIKGMLLSANPNGDRIIEKMWNM